MKSTIIALNAVSGLAQMAQFGVIYTLMALWLDAHGMSTWHIGLVGTSVWIGMLAGNLFAPLWLQMVGPKRLAGIGCVGTALLAVVMPEISTTSVSLWSIAAALLGVGVGLRWIGVESWLYTVARGTSLGRVVGLHETVIHIAQSSGPALVALIGLKTHAAFYAGGLLAIAAIGPLLLAQEPPPVSNPDAASGPMAVLRGMWAGARRSQGTQLGLLAGLIDGLLFTMIGIYFVKQGMRAEQAAVMVTVFGVGGLLSQLPLGWWSDRFGVRSATYTIAIAGLLGSCLLLVADPALAWPAALLLGCVAGCGLSVAIIAATVNATRFKRNMGVAVTEVSIAFTVGSAVGPALGGLAMDFWGPASLPALSATFCLGLFMSALKTHARPNGANSIELK